MASQICRYRVTTATEVNPENLPPGEDGAGTDAAVIIHIEDDKGNGFSRELNNPDRNDREPGQIDEFMIEGPVTDPMTRIGFRIPSPPTGRRWNWRCKWVEVVNETTQFSVFVDNFGSVARLDEPVWKKASPGRVPVRA